MNRNMDSYNSEFQDDRGDDNNRGLGDQIDLQHYLRILRKHKWPITLFTALVTALGTFYAYTATPIYSAKSTLLIEQQKTAGMEGISELFDLNTENTDYYQTQYELLKSRALASKVINKLKLWDDPQYSQAARLAQPQAPIDGSEAVGFQGFLHKTKVILGLIPADEVIGEVVELSEEDAEALSFEENQVQRARERQATITAFVNGLSIAPIRRTKLVNISYESPDPELAARVANTYAEQYIESYLDAKLEMTTKATSWLSEKLAALKITLDESKKTLIAYKEANNLVDVDGSVGRLNEQELLLLTTELARARTELSQVSDVYEQVKPLRSRPRLLESIPAMQIDPLVRQVKIEQGQEQRKLDELLNRYGERHPRVVDAQSQLDTLNKTLEGHLLRAASSIEKDYELTRQNVETIEQKLAEGKQAIQAIGTKKFELDALEREVTTNQELYDTFFNRMSEARSADGLETANARLSDIAVIPHAPIKPRKQLLIALSALASLMLAVLMAFLYEQMDDTVKGTRDVETKLGVRLLGIFPMIKNGMFKGGRALPLNPTEIKDKKGTFAEAVNTARTAICLGDEKSPRKVIMVTSSVPAEGKSTVSINLAYSLAQLERVLLIDCDMRRPTVAKAAGFDGDVLGLSNLITKTASARNCIKQGVFDGAVDILPSGPIPDQPLELLSSKRFEKILEQLSMHYDRIIIDCAPTQAVSDALVLSRYCDGVVYAIKSHETSIELVRRGLQRLAQVKANVIGVLITQVDIDKIAAYGGDYYYQGYYDYYGYTEKGGKQSGKMRLNNEQLISLKADDSDVTLDLGKPSKVGGFVGVAANGSGFNASLSHDDTFDQTMDAVDSDEFDLTAQLDKDFPQLSDREKHADNRRRFGKRGKDDDLDII